MCHADAQADNYRRHMCHADAQADNYRRHMCHADAPAHNYRRHMCHADSRASKIQIHKNKNSHLKADKIFKKYLDVEIIWCNENNFIIIKIKFKT